VSGIGLVILIVVSRLLFNPSTSRALSLSGHQVNSTPAQELGSEDRPA
jgi:hypothetical protein